MLATFYETINNEDQKSEPHQGPAGIKQGIDQGTLGLHEMGQSVLDKPGGGIVLPKEFQGHAVYGIEEYGEGCAHVEHLEDDDEVECPDKGFGCVIIENLDGVHFVLPCLVIM